MTEPPNPSPPISDAVREFLHDLEGIKSAEQIVCPLIAKLALDTSKRFHQVAEPFKVKTDDAGRETYMVPFAADKAFRAVRRERQRTSSAFLQTPRALFVAMVSTFDAYLGRLLRSLFILKPELIHASQRSLPFSELVRLDSIHAAREHIIAEEIESFLRNSHIDHFNWLETRLNMQLRRDLGSWPTFVELTQRRNLYVHCDGLVSKQYLEICKSNGVSLDGVDIGTPLRIDPNYFDQAFSCLFEIGVKLAHVSWRKLAPDQIKDADTALNGVCFDLLQNERYQLAHNLLTFATATLKKHSSALNRRIFVINLAIACKFGNTGDVTQCLQAEDWSDCGSHFALAKFVLEDKFDEAAYLMKSIGSENDFVTRSDYDTWPLFKSFRESDQFRERYKDLFGEEFVVEKTDGDAEVPRAIDEHDASDDEAEGISETEPPAT
jgi:hypothetical protein